MIGVSAWCLTVGQNLNFIVPANQIKALMISQKEIPFSELQKEGESIWQQGSKSGATF